MLPIEYIEKDLQGYFRDMGCTNIEVFATQEHTGSELKLSVEIGATAGKAVNFQPQMTGRVDLYNMVRRELLACDRNATDMIEAGKVTRDEMDEHVKFCESLLNFIREWDPEVVRTKRFVACMEKHGPHNQAAGVIDYLTGGPHVS